ncbi:MAG: hypothetical protein IPN39_13605 [Chitinophagaceae bacterium]|nr:hypothetical protein [Chitinophagaceae bacterium]
MKKITLIIILILAVFISCKKNNDGGTTTPPPPPPPPPPPVVVLNTADSVLLLDETVSGSKESTRLAQNNPASDFYTTGFYLPASTIMTVEVTSVNGSRLPTLLVGTYSRYQASWNPTSHTLTSGVNSIADATGVSSIFDFTTIIQQAR